MIKRNKNIFLIALLFILSQLFISNCSDNFDETIMSESNPGNNNTGDGDYNNLILLTSFATAREGAASIEYNGLLYIYGGEDYFGIKDDFWCYDLSNNTFELLSSDISRAYSSFARIDNKLYIFGGVDSSGNAIDSFKYYDISSDSWVEITTSDTTGSWPSARFSHAVVSYQDDSNSIKKLYIHGGFVDSANNASGDLYELDLNGSPKPGWSIASLSDVRGGHSAILVDDNIYFFGGKDISSGTYKNDIIKYDIDNNTSESISVIEGDLPGSREKASNIEYNGSFYIYGGNNDSEIFNDLWQFNPTTSIWEKKLNLNVDLTSFSSIIYNNKLYLFGGYNENSTGQKVYNSNLYFYDFTSL